MVEVECGFIGGGGRGACPPPPQGLGRSSQITRRQGTGGRGRRGRGSRGTHRVLFLKETIGLPKETMQQLELFLGGAEPPV